MRIYEVVTKMGTHVVEAEDFSPSYGRNYTLESCFDALVFYRGETVVAVFKEWEILLDITNQLD